MLRSVSPRLGDPLQKVIYSSNGRTIESGGYGTVGTRSIDIQSMGVVASMNDPYAPAAAGPSRCSEEAIPGAIFSREIEK